MLFRGLADFFVIIITEWSGKIDTLREKNPGKGFVPYEAKGKFCT